MRRPNTVGVKILKSLLFLIMGTAVFITITPVIFNIGSTMLSSLPLETPTNFKVIDYIGMFVMFLEGLILLVYTKKWMWR